MTKEPQEEIKERVYYEEPHPNQNCCDKCHDVIFEKTYPAHTAYHACLNRKCECHKPQEETYQTLENKALEEFDDKFQGWKNTKLDFITGEVEWTKAREINYIVCSKKEAKDFLKSHLQLAYKAGEEKGLNLRKAYNDPELIEQFCQQAITSEKERIGKEFREWFHAGNISEPIEDAIERITKVKC